MSLRQRMFKSSPELFLRTVASLFTAALIVTTVVNGLIDPYDVWRVVTISALPNRPMQRGHDRMHKAVQVYDEVPDAIILGTSRAQVMIDPRSRAFGHYAARPLNAAVDSSIPYEARRYVEHAFERARQAGSKVKLIVYGLDLGAFDRGRPPNEEFSEARLLVGRDGRAQPFARFADTLSTLLSFDALLASGATILRRDWPSYLLPSGQRDPNFQEQGVVRMGGQRALFQLSERDYGENYACFEEAPSDSQPYGELRRIVELAAESSAVVRFYISPFHARHGVVIRTAGLSGVDQRWRRRLADQVEQLQSEGHDVKLWDFSGVESDEWVPSALDRTSRMRWWWESSHATSALGDRLVLRLLDAPGAEPLGQELTRASVDASIARLEQEQRAWEAGHAAEAAEAARETSGVLARVRPATCPRDQKTLASVRPAQF